MGRAHIGAGRHVHPYKSRRRREQGPDNKADRRQRINEDGQNCGQDNDKDD